MSSQLSSVGVSRNRAKCWTWKWNWDRKASVPVTVTGQYSLVGRHVIRADENFNSRQMKESSAEGRSLAGVKVNMKLLSWPTYSSNREHAVMRWETGVSWTHGDTAQRAIKGVLLSILRKNYLFDCLTPVLVDCELQENSVLTTNLCSLLVCNLWTVPLSLRIVVNVVKI